jgi:hypothetical protein
MLWARLFANTVLVVVISAGSGCSSKPAVRAGVITETGPVSPAAPQTEAHEPAPAVTGAVPLVVTRDLPPGLPPLDLRQFERSIQRDSSGPAATQFGVFNWPARFERGQVVTIEDQLPGIPVTIEVDTREFTVVEAPSAANRWNRISLRSNHRRQDIAEIKWRSLAR